MREQAVVRTSLVANRSLMPSGMPSSGRASPALSRASALLRHRARALRRLQHIGVERARLLDRGEMRVGELGGGERALAQAVARLGERERRQLGHLPSGAVAGERVRRLAVDRLGRLRALRRHRQPGRLEILRLEARRNLAALDRHLELVAPPERLFFAGPAHAPYSTTFGTAK